VVALSLAFAWAQPACTSPVDAPVTTFDHEDEEDFSVELGDDENDAGDGGSASPPTAVVAPATRVDGDEAVLDARDSYDSDGDNIEIVWTQVEGEPVEFPNGQEGARIRIVTPSAGLYRFRATVSDGEGQSSQDAVVLRESSQERSRHFVVHISVDGLHSQAVSLANERGLPGFRRLVREGASTLNARTDPSYTVTLPNHTSQLTSRFVNALGGHRWRANSAGSTSSIHTNAGEYIWSIFDVLYLNQSAGALYSGKSKFILFDNSYGRGWGESLSPPPTTHPLAKTVIQPNLDELVERVLFDLQHAPRRYQFVHLAEPDNRGHSYGWDLESESKYFEGIRAVDRALAELLETIDESDVLRDSTTVILTADHGGYFFAHDAIDNPQNFTIPFIVWGAKIPANADLYAMNPKSRLDPEYFQITSDGPVQPIRNGEAANLAANLLGFDPIPGSQINAAFDLNVESPANDAP
jgi:hypothetical protein